MDTKERASIKKGVAYSLMITAVVLVLMMIFGVIMLLNQGKVISIPAQLFYKIMTVHGTGMVGIASLGGSAILWYFLSKYVRLNSEILFINLILSVVGVVMILIGIFVFNFSDGWTFLYPLPSFSAKITGNQGPLLFLFGLLAIGIGYLIMYVHLAARIIKEYGGLGKALGWDQILEVKKAMAPHPQLLLQQWFLFVIQLEFLLVRQPF
jgi:cytochrome c oxidase subunit 1